MSQKTRECTKVYCWQPVGPGLPDFECRKFDRRLSPGIKPFKVSEEMDHEAAIDNLTALIDSTRVGRRRQRERGSAKQLSKLVRKQKINWKRQLLLSYMQRQSLICIKDAARYAGVSQMMAKRVRQHMLLGTVETFEYPHLKSEDQISALQESIQQLNQSYQTVSDLKRRHSCFSRKWILRELHKEGYKWRRVQRNTLKPKEKPNSKKICEVICHLVQAHSCTDVEVLFLDEMHFPLYQTADRHWINLQSTPQEEVRFYNRRPSPEGKLSAIALCSTRRFEAIQLFVKDVTAVDFSYFLTKAFSNLPKDKRYLVLADNATWHTADIVGQSKAGKLLYFNVKGMYQLNLIENAFSFVRNSFRKREQAESLQEEAKLILDIFFDLENQARFEGVYRNHLRNLFKYLKLHSPFIEPQL